MRNFFLAAGICLLVSCAPYFLFETPVPPITAKPGKTTIVYMRSLNMPELKSVTMVGPGGHMSNSVSVDPEGAESFIYVDGKYVGGLLNSCLAVFEVDPGIHLITSESDFQSNLKINAVAGRAYFIEEIPIQMGPPITQAEAVEKMKSFDYKLSKPNPERKKDDLDDDDVQDNLKDWDDWAKDNPADAKKQMDYNGY
jgi:hypothetical protein